MNTQELTTKVASLDWYHTFSLPGGVVTPGMFDHRAIVDRYLIPEDLTGKRCLDVGTMDGFWAFEMERRGAEVVAVDVDDESELDWPRSIRAKVEPVMDQTKAERFAIVAEALDSKVERRLVSVYDLDSQDLGTFDVVFCGDLLTHLKNPVGALEGLYRVTDGIAIVCNPTIPNRINWRIRRAFPPLKARPLVEFDGIDQFQWWALTEEALTRMMRAVGFDQVHAGESFELPATGDGPPKWRGLRSVVRGSRTG